MCTWPSIEYHHTKCCTARTTFSISGEFEAFLGETARAPFHTKTFASIIVFRNLLMPSHRTDAQRILEAIYASLWRQRQRRRRRRRRRHKHKTQQISGNVPYSERHVITFYVCHTSWPRWPTNFLCIYARALGRRARRSIESRACALRSIARRSKSYFIHITIAATTHYSRIDLFPLMIFLVRSLCLCIDGLPLPSSRTQVCARFAHAFDLLCIDFAHFNQKIIHIYHFYRV